MGALSRTIWTAVPTILATVSLIFLILLALAGTKSSSLTADTYFLQINTSLPATSGSVADANKLDSAIHVLPIYRVSLFTYCSGINGSDTCFPRHTNYFFNITEVFNLTSAIESQILGKDFQDANNTYHTAAHWIWVLYIIAFVALIVEILLTLIVPFSRLFSLGAHIASFVTSLFLSGFASLATATYVILKNAGNLDLKKSHGIEFTLGNRALAWVWLAVAFQLAYSISRALFACCGPSTHHRQKTGPKRQGTYQQVEDPWRVADDVPLRAYGATRDVDQETERGVIGHDTTMSGANNNHTEGERYEDFRHERSGAFAHDSHEPYEPEPTFGNERGIGQERGPFEDERRYSWEGDEGLNVGQKRGPGGASYL